MTYNFIAWNIALEKPECISDTWYNTKEEAEAALNLVKVAERYARAIVVDYSTPKPTIILELNHQTITHYLKCFRPDITIRRKLYQLFKFLHLAK